MRWQDLPADEVAELAKVTDVALLPIGCVETHGPHMPTGTDAISAEGLAMKIAEKEPAIVLPTIYYNVNDEMKCYPGVISIPPNVVVKLLEAICDEAARNSFRRIVLLATHGDSNVPITFLQTMLLEHNRTEGMPKKNYMVFRPVIPKRVMEWIQKEVLEDYQDEANHGGEAETSLVMYFRPDLVKKEKLEPLPEGEGPHIEVPEGPRLINNVIYRLDWIKQVPKGYVGKPQLATKKKGEKIAEAYVDAYVKIIRDIKKYEFNP